MAPVRKAYRFTEKQKFGPNVNSEIKLRNDFYPDCNGRGIEFTNGPVNMSNTTIKSIVFEDKFTTKDFNIAPSKDLQRKRTPSVSVDEISSDPEPEVDLPQIEPELIIDEPTGGFEEEELIDEEEEPEIT